MRNFTFYLSLLSLIFLNACQKEILQKKATLSSATPKTEVLASELDPSISQSQKTVNGYLFKAEDLSSFLSTLNLYEIRFVLNYENGGIQINAVGVNFLGDELKSVPSNKFYEESFDQKLLKLNTLPENIAKVNNLENQYLLPPKEALKYIQDYREKLNSGYELNEITLCKGERINHFSLEKKILVEMLRVNKAKNIALFLGVDKGKLTTVFIGMDENKNLVLPMPESDNMNFSGYVFGLAKPCPSNHITNL